MLSTSKINLKIFLEIVRINPSVSLVTKKKGKMNPYYPGVEPHKIEETPLQWQEEHNLLTNSKESRNSIKILLTQDRCGRLKMKKETTQMKTEGKTETFQAIIVKI